MYAYPTISIPKLHHEYRLWMQELEFYKEEIRLFERQLEEMANKNTKVKVTAGIEQFQNRFICQIDVIAHLQHQLHGAEKQLTAFVHQVSGMGLSSIKMDNHTKLREEVRTFKKLFEELKHDFRRFKSIWM